MSRWSDNDRNWGPFTFAWADRYRPLAVVLKSWGSGDDDDGPASLRLSMVYCTFIVRLPPILYPQRRKVYPAGWDAATIERLGRNWYWDVKVREYGFSYSGGFLQVHYGICPGDSSRDQNWCTHLPWTQWRHIRHSFYGLSGEHFWTIPEGMKWDERSKIEETVPTTAFAFKDFDGTDLIATTKIEEREWKFGQGWFKWLSLFRAPKIHRSLDIRFSDEVGPEKGSWKGGTIGTSIEMLPGELHEAAFRRFCDEDHRSKYRKFRITFVGHVDASVSTQDQRGD